MKVLMIVQNNFVNDARIKKEAISLGKKGHIVTVLALYEKKLCKIENYEYFNVHRVKLVTRNKLSKKNKYIQSIKYIEFFYKCISFAKKFNPEVIHCHDVFTLPMGFLIKRKLKCKLVYDSHELWSKVHSVEESPWFLRQAVKILEKKAFSKCDRTITVSKSIADYFLSNYKTNSKPIVLRNIPNKNYIKKNKDLFRKEYPIKKDQKIILYQGAVQAGRGVDKIIELIPKLDKDIVFVVLGNGLLIHEYKKLTKNLCIEQRVFFHKAVNQEELVYYTSSADLGIHLMENICLNHYYALPNKIFEYLQSGLPIICSEFPEMIKIINDYGVGLGVNPDNIDVTSDKINLLFSNPNRIELIKENVQKASDILCWENEEVFLIELYDSFKKTII